MPKDMSDIVVFRLEAPMAAFGDLAVGERRGTHRRPSASAIMGLVAAALGMPREAQGHEELARCWRLALRKDDLGAPLADFHTAQTPPQKRGRSYSTRREELADKNELGTIVSRRDYWTDAAFTIALWPCTERAPEPDAHAIVRALMRPQWALYAGRRACPLSRPLAPRVIAAQTLEAAFAGWDEAENAARQAASFPKVSAGQDFILDETFGPGGALAAAMGALQEERREIRRDALVSRQRWQFDARSEILARMPVVPAPEVNP